MSQGGSIGNGGAGGVTAVSMQTFTSTGTYTPTSGMKYCIVELWGGGGGSGGCLNTGAFSASAGAGGGGYARKTYSAATIGVSQAVTIGAGGAGGASGNNNGTDGTASTFLLMSAGGGVHSVGYGNAGVVSSPPGAGGTSTGGDLNVKGQSGGCSLGQQPIGLLISGFGGSGGVGGGGGTAISQNGNAVAGFFPGGGAGGGALDAVNSIPGASGANGYCVITEYI